MVMVAIALPVLILFASFAIDVGNWFVHARHLQTQADAGALAAAGDFQFPCDNAKIEQRAKEYAGAESGGYNHQIGGTALGNVKFALNSSTYPNQPDKTDPTVVAEPPCQAEMIDVKVTETDLPLFLRVAGLFTSVPFINAHARVQIFNKRSASGALPVAVPDSNPRSASVTFINESTHEILGTRQLTRDGTSGELAIWDNAGEPLPLTVGEGDEKVGMRVALGGSGATGCGEPLVECYDAESENGLLYVRGYSMAGSGAQPAAPLARSVKLTGESACANPYFTIGGCNVGVDAHIDFGPCEKIEGVGAKLTAKAGASSYEMKLVGCPVGTSSSEWETTGAPMPIGVGVGPVSVELTWEETKGEEGVGKNGTPKCESGKLNPCKGTFGIVQRTFAASEERSGPILFAQLSEGDVSGADSLERCSAVQSSCTHELVATIGVEQNLLEIASNASAPPVALHFAGGSQTQALNCDPNLNLEAEFAQGCTPKFAINTGTACPTTTPELWAAPEPLECVAVETGEAKGQVWHGMNERILGNQSPSTCTAPNNWGNFPNIDYANDPRVVPLIITPFGTFTGTGSENVPVTNLAMFYVTGWEGTKNQTSQSTCAGDENPEEVNTILGHFIKYVEALNKEETTEETCDPSALTPCVAVLTE